MPHISLSLYPGRDEKDVEEMCRRLQQTLIDMVGWKPGDISVSVEGIKPEEFAEKMAKKIKTEKIVISSDYIK